MINTKNINKDKKMGLTPDERKSKVAKLREEHEDYFQAEWKGNALYIPKMAYRPKGKDEYELITSSSGFQRHLIPVSELKVINDVTSRKNVKAVISNPIPFEDLTGPDPISIESAMVNKLEDINQSIITLTKVITKLIK